MYLSSENKLFSSLNELVKKHKIVGIKAEFEAEGSNNANIFKLRSITNKLNTQLHVKIGGVEAINDIYFCIEASVDGIISPMVETKFGLKKFLESINKLKLKKKPFLSINIETITGYNNLNEILPLAYKNIDNITIGRSDLASSLFKNEITQNSKELEKKIIIIAKKAKKYKLNCTIGGGVDKNTVIQYKKNKELNLIKKIETRKIIFDRKRLINNKSALDKAIDFEKNYIHYKKEINDLKLNTEILRLTKLEIRK